MKNYKLVKNNHGIGITCDGLVVIPYGHKTKKGAIGELIYFETENTNRPKHRQFLDHCLTHTEISELKEQLTAQQVD